MSATTGGNLPDSASIAGQFNDSSQSQQPAPSRSDDSSRPLPEKTISCVSCRKRKLKCDRAKPSCATCARLRHECEYPERRRNLGSKRRNMKELEARLAQVETQLVGETKSSTAGQYSVTEVGVNVGNASMETDWNSLGMDMNIDMDDSNLMDPSFAIPSQYNMLPENTALDTEPFFSQELLALGLQEPLPPEDMMTELYEIYFERFHPTMPMMHRSRFYASLTKAPNARPPICLRYAMFAIAASLSDKYTSIEELLYERSRKYIQIDEMKGHGEAFISIQHAQAWGLMASYEAKKTYFSRSWMSAGRIIRLCHMLGLDRLDSSNPGIKTILPPARDVIEREERRRTFWAAYYADRWSSSGTGWPMIINEEEIKTNLPISEYSFDHGIDEPTISLQTALGQDGASKISPFSGVIMSATLFGHNFQHLHKVGPNENPDDLQNGEFWKRHRKMDNVLSNTFMLLPDQLRLPAGLHNMNVVFLNLNIHTSAICLHQAAAATGTKHKLDENFIKQSQSRCIMASDEITNIMRLTCHLDPAKMHSWVGFCLYVAAGIYVKNQKSAQPYAQSLPNLEFLLTAMRAIGRKHPITKHFIAQLELDIEAAAIYKKMPALNSHGRIPNLPINGLLVDRNGQKMTLEDMESYHTGGSSSGSEHLGNSKLTPGSDIMMSEGRITSIVSSPDDPTPGNEENANPLLIPENYFPGAKNSTQWTSSEFRITDDVPGKLSRYPGDINVFMEGPNTIVQDVPSKLQPFFIGMDSAPPKAAQMNPETAPRNPNNPAYRTVSTSIFDPFIAGTDRANTEKPHEESDNNTRTVTELGFARTQNMNDPAQIEPFIHGINSISTAKPRGEPEDTATKSPSNDFHTLRFPYRQANIEQQTSPVNGGLYPWADADPAITEQWSQFADYDNQNLNIYQNTPDWSEGGT